MRYYVGMKKNQNLPFNAPLTLLGGITPEAFLKEYWHKKPLLVRGAIPAFAGLLSPNGWPCLRRRCSVPTGIFL
jgi:ribosomal protein L16 Arg81 hydroxylase